MEIVNSMNQIADYNIEVRVNPKFIRKNDTRTLTGSPQKLFSLIGEVNQKPFQATLKGMVGRCLFLGFSSCISSAISSTV